MNIKDNANRVERAMRTKYGLRKDPLGFDGSLNGFPVEVKGCIPMHKNGVDYKGDDKLTKGRFWIERESHKLLLKYEGIYIFVLYEIVEGFLIVRSTDLLSAKYVDRMIGDGDNTKIRYNLIFEDIDSLEA